MNLKRTVEKYLESEPLARERRSKDRAIVNILLKIHPDFNQRTVSKETLVEIFGNFASMDRYWRQLMEEREDLRGTDYETKEKVSQEKQIELGYTPNYHEDRKLGLRFKTV